MWSDAAHIILVIFIGFLALVGSVVGIAYGLINDPHADRDSSLRQTDGEEG